MFKHFDVINRSLSERFISQIRIACVTENENIKALIVDREDDVYAIGKDYNEISEPFKLESICKSGVINFSFGRGHVVALTDEGNVFTWGQNDHQQCGNGGEEYLKVPVQIAFNQMNLNEKVTNIKCGWDHTLALTDSGSLYAWGRNYYGQCGTGTRDNVKVPEKLNIDKVKSIACGAGHSMALLANGRVYGWGENGDGQLGLGRETHCERNPCYVAEFKEIKTLTCGMYHTLALSTSNQLYTCGFNEYVNNLNFFDQCKDLVF
jgi:RCC1 and BTB domain-containing protein